jgi:hypothetical protein
VKLQLWTKISLKSCGVAIAEVLPSSCEIAIADLKKVLHASVRVTNKMASEKSIV